MIIQFQINDLPKRINSVHGRSWMIKHAESKKWLRLVDQAVKKKPATPFKKAKLTLERHSSVQPDFDGLVYTFKPVIDALKKLGVLEDDSMDHIGQPAYLWHKQKPSEGFIRVMVEEIK